MSNPVEETEESKEEVLHPVKVVVNFLSRERKTIELGDLNEGQVKTVVGTVNSAFEVIHKSEALGLTGKDGIAVFVHLRNVEFIEVYVG